MMILFVDNCREIEASKLGIKIKYAKNLNKKNGRSRMRAAVFRSIKSEWLISHLWET